MSAKPNTYYDYILRKRMVPPAGRSMQELRCDLDNDKGDAHHQWPAVARVAVPPVDPDLALDDEPLEPTGD